MYIVQADLLSQISEHQLVQLTDDEKTGLVVDARVDEAIGSAEAEVNGYVATRYAVPVAAPAPDLIKKLSITITVYLLYRRRQRVPDDVRTAYEDAIAMLKDIARGVITLGIDPPPAESTKASAGEVSGPERIFSRDKLGSF